MPKDFAISNSTMKEIQVLKMMNQSNYVQKLFDVNYDRNSIYLILEFCDFDLQTFLKTENLNQKQRIQICLDLAKGLKDLHEKGFINRDIKPSNCLVKVQNQEFQAKLSDFSLAISAQFSNDFSSKVGTLGYKAPELCCFKVNYSFEVDIFSFGCTIYEIITKKQFLNVSNEDEELQQLIYIYGTSEFNKQCYQSTISKFAFSESHFKIFQDLGEIGDIIKMCIQPNYEKRPNAEQLLQMIQDNKFIKQFINEIVLIKKFSFHFSILFFQYLIQTFIEIPQGEYIELHQKRFGKRLDAAERERKKEARSGTDFARKAKKTVGMRGIQLQKKRRIEKIELKKKIRQQNEKEVKSSDNTDNQIAKPAFLLDRQTENRAKILSNSIKEKKKTRAAVWDVPITKVDPLSDSQVFKVLRSGKRKNKEWKRKITMATLQERGFTRKSPKYERFIKPSALRYRFANVTHPDLKCVKKNPSSQLYTDLNVITKGTIIEVRVDDLGLITQSGKIVWGKYAQVTNKPEVDGCINAVLIV